MSFILSCLTGCCRTRPPQEAYAPVSSVQELVPAAPAPLAATSEAAPYEAAVAASFSGVSPCRSAVAGAAFSGLARASSTRSVAYEVLEIEENFHSVCADLSSRYQELAIIRLDIIQ